VNHAIYDVVIVGAGPAGGAAAIQARRLGLTCLVVGGSNQRRGGSQLDWVGPAGLKLCKSIGLSATAAGAREFSGLQLRSWDFRKSTRVSEPTLRGWVVDRPTFERALVALASEAGAEVNPTAVPSTLTLGEQYVEIGFQEGGVARGRVLLIGDGLESVTAELARITTARRCPSVASWAEMEFEAAGQQAGLDVIIGSRRSPHAATILYCAGRGRLRMVTQDTSSPVEAQFSELLRGAQAARLIPQTVQRRVVTGLTPSGAALDAETLIGKRCLLIGETGGFVAAFSDESIYPGMKSGCVAVEVVARALKAPVFQDELQEFNPAWRRELADYLRLPNTDLCLLMPLVFSNARMSARIARAFLLGAGF
jgi:flavin-dependent dehydrogenase